MAYSQPLTDSVKRKGQTPLLCQLCENDPKIKWKCLDCSLMMCHRCRDKVHPKFPSAEDHSVVDIKEVCEQQTNPEPKPDLTRIKCDKHVGKVSCMYCTTCQELVCQTCIAKTHNAHNFSEIDDEYETKLEKVKIRLKTLERDIQILAVNEKKLRQIKVTEHSKYDTVKQEILDYEESVVIEIKKQTRKHLKELDQKWDAFSNKVENEVKMVKEKQRKIQEERQNINTLLSPSKDNNMIFVSNALLKSQETNESLINTTFQGVPELNYGDKTKLLLVQGKLVDVTIQCNAEPQIEKSFVTELDAISSVVFCPNDSLWISDSRQSRLQKVKPNKGNLGMLSNFKLGVIDEARLPSGDLLLSVKGSSNLQLIPSGSADIQDSVYTVSPLQPTGVHVTCDNKVIIGARGGESPFPITGPRKIIVLDQAGHREKVIQYDRHNKPLFTNPYRVTSNSQGNIAVLDCVSEDFKGRIVVLNQARGVRNIYTGHPKVNNKNNPFKPSGITATPLDNFVVADCDNHTLHVLNNEGEIITFYTTKEMGIILPCSIIFSIAGQLYIGCCVYKDSKEKAKLLTVDHFLY